MILFDDVDIVMRPCRMYELKSGIMTQVLVIDALQDPKSLLYLFGLTLDHSDELIGGGYKFTNPNASSSCGCGTSFSI